ncbi:MAG TPA: alpha/beta hydrolase [Pseudonocardia sp.]|nr:alpha/beta hydrolase [Pseudonocardia sp.]
MIAGCAGPPQSEATRGTPPELSKFYNQHLQWSGCAKHFQCSKLTVPLDYAAPDGPTIQIAVVRAPATDPAHRVGSLLTNPGGPGASGVDYVESAYPESPGDPSDFGATLQRRFDIVGFDPRGVGQSAPVHCLDDAQLDQFTALDPAPTTPEQINQVVAGYKNFIAGCQSRSGGLLAHVSSENAARDMDILRAALGDPKLNYLGYSYGTYLGAMYTDLFAQRVGRFVLDGPVPPDLTSQQIDLRQSRGFQVEVDRFISDCATHPDCPLGTDPSTGSAKLQAFLAGTATHPIPTGTPRVVASGLAETGVLSAMYDSPVSWPRLRRALSDAMAGDGHRLLKLADEYNGRHRDGHYDNQNQANVAINCLDQPDSVRSVADVQAELPQYQQASWLAGPSDAWEDLMCTYWPQKAQARPHEVHYAGAPPILVLGNTQDPATPYAGAQDMARQLGAAVLVTYDGDGHTAYGRDIDCINNLVDAYLGDGTVPARGTVCRPDSPGNH